MDDSGASKTISGRRVRRRPLIYLCVSRIAVTADRDH
jgi:hypothetical protein